MLCGLHRIDSIDLVAHQPDTDSVWLMIYHHENPAGRYAQGLNGPAALREKLAYYHQFVVSGNFSEEYPDLARKPVTIQLELGQPLSPDEEQVVQRFAEHLQESAGITLAIRQIGADQPAGEQE